MKEILEPGLAIEEIWISPGHDFRGRHGKGRLEHGDVAVSEVECVAGMGLKGDRYFGFKEDYKGQVTFLAMEVVEELRARFGDFPSSQLRRNVIVRGADLDRLLSKKFRLQGVLFEGSEECKPCLWMDEVVGEGAEKFLKAGCRGGLRARILEGGTLRVA
ncbi:MAG: molybdenum cofactor biosysynthesis protein [Armatimonadetes bacterium]|nr:molybdenum cofactor biosysynthesis protein [Akkermansiaceae bacterium]